MINKLTIFLSHSHKDIDKVRKLREIFESLEFEPLIFYLQCLDDKNDELEDFIKREIDARNVFVYCKSKNAENSKWVQKELEYIKNSHIRRLYTIDIDLPLNQTFVTLLNSLCELIKHNSVFISCSSHDKLLGNSLQTLLSKNGYNSVLRFDTLNNQDEHDKVVREIVKNGIFLPVITPNYMKSIYCQAELEGALYSTDYGINPLIFPLVVNYNIGNALNLVPKLSYYNCYSFDFENEFSAKNESNIIDILKSITHSNNN